MATDCIKLSKNTRKIFNALKPFYPLDPFKKPNWRKEGKVYDNGWFDLRKHKDREKLEEQKKNFIGYAMCLDASGYKKRDGSLDKFMVSLIPASIRSSLEILLLLQDLDFQIETLDLMEM